MTAGCLRIHNFWLDEAAKAIQPSRWVVEYFADLTCLILYILAVKVSINFDKRATQLQSTSKVHITYKMESRHHGQWTGQKGVHICKYCTISGQLWVVPNGGVVLGLMWYQKRKSFIFRIFGGLEIFLLSFVAARRNYAGTHFCGGILNSCFTWLSLMKKNVELSRKSYLES